MQGLSEAAGSDVLISFTPHLMPMTRGMQSTCYVKMADGVDVQQLRQRLEVQYAANTLLLSWYHVCDCVVHVKLFTVAAVPLLLCFVTSLCPKSLIGDSSISCTLHHEHALQIMHSSCSACTLCPSYVVR